MQPHSAIPRTDSHGVAPGRIIEDLSDGCRQRNSVTWSYDETGLARSDRFDCSSTDIGHNGRDAHGLRFKHGYPK